MSEARDFTAKIEKAKLYLAQTGKAVSFVCPVYLSATGFKTKVETWLHEQGVLTTTSVHKFATPACHGFRRLNVTAQPRRGKLI
ncbi:MAG: hypothetical protein GY862_09195 [Gammaproteobacteria bacterium]|nr:hypothetical protein [Gammaproteobacteria bacterium]